MSARETAALAGRRILVVGASSGIGRAVAAAASGAGARVAAAARRVELAEQTSPELAVACDVRRGDDCRLVVERCIAAFGGLDAVVYAAGVAPLAPLAELDEAGWATVLATNVSGAALVVGAALPHLQQARGHAVFLGTHSVSRPYPGLVAYAASKAALATLVTGWRAECPDVCFSHVAVGPTITSFADAWDTDLTGRYFDRWLAEGYWEPTQSDADDVAQAVLAVLTAPSRLEELRVMPPR